LQIFPNLIANDYKSHVVVNGVVTFWLISSSVMDFKKLKGDNHNLVTSTFMNLTTKNYLLLMKFQLQEGLHLHKSSSI
jgi:hypothetical protein